MAVAVGAHVKREDPIAAATERGADLVQVFLGDPQSWSAPQVDFDGGATALRESAEQAGVGIVVHAPYVLNVASLNNRIRIPSRKQLQKTVTLAAQIGAIGVVVHGGHVRAEDDPEVGYDNWRKAIDQLEAPVPIFVENTAGGTNSMARGVAKIERLWEAVRAADGGDEVGFCLDTAHAFAGGDELDGLAAKIVAATGRIDLVHANNSKGAFDSGADRHAAIHDTDAGLIPADQIGALLKDAGAPVILETPGPAPVHAEEITWVRGHLS
ncbi:MAG TPA: deoxyribonuclease IV [Beutenbergiaceae bacterium]|nr:deoxyribonuclease IV [Beutenbergiaceae bacterium]